MRARTIVIGLLLVALGAAGALVAPRLETWRARYPASSAKATYQCPMHPQIVSDQPGNCPICEMKLQRTDLPADAAQPEAAVRRPLFYRHPMRPDVTSPEPAKDEMGMDYIPVYDDEAGTEIVAGRAGFTLSAERQQLIGVTRATVERRRLDGAIHAVGKVAYDPALYQAIVEYHEAVAARSQLGEDAMLEARKGAEAIVRSATLRLRQLGMSEAQLREIAAQGSRPVDLLLPSKTAWVYAQVYEYEMDAVRPGQTVTVSNPAQRGRTYEGQVVNVDPILDPATRTARVRVRVPAADANLRPEAFVHATIHVPTADVVAVPADAVLPSGTQQIVFVVTGTGTFTPRAVRLGREAGGAYEVLEGLRPGEEVLTSANFLIDSESRFRAALAAFSKTSAAGAGRAAGTPPAEPR